MNQEKLKELEPLHKYLIEYQQTLRLLLEALPEDASRRIHRSKYRAHLATGNTEVWICRDGVVAFILNKLPFDGSDIEIRVYYRDNPSKTMLGFLNERSSILWTFHDPISKAQYSGEFPPEFADTDEDTGFLFLRLNYEQHESSFIPLVSKAIVMGWKAIGAIGTHETYSPVSAATDDIRGAFTSINLGSENDAYALLRAFEGLLEEASKEEELQIFLKEHPEFLYPAQITCHPKFRLGDDYITDYVLLVQASHGSEYVFVEIERANKRIFTTSGQFTADFTQARAQLLDWEAWITRNHAYISSKLQNLYKPKFHLVMGRDSELTPELRNKIQTNFSGSNTQFSTYDDLALGYKQVVSNLLKS